MQDIRTSQKQLMRHQTKQMDLIAQLNSLDTSYYRNLQKLSE